MKSCFLSFLLWIFSPVFLFAQANTDSIRKPSVDTLQTDSPINAFTCTLREADKVVLNWQASAMHEGDYFAVERSNNGNSFETIGILKQSGSADRYELTDSAPPDGADIYRIKYIHSEGHASWSRPLTVNLAYPRSDFKFYPNPADKVLIVRTDHAIDLQIIDGMGATRLTKQLAPGLQVINVSSLEKGNYILRATDKDSNKVISEHFLKN